MTKSEEYVLGRSVPVPAWDWRCGAVSEVSAHDVAELNRAIGEKARHNRELRNAGKDIARNVAK